MAPGLISPDKSPSAERAHTRSISGPAEAACTRPFGKCASSEGNLGCHRIGTLAAQVIQQRVDALMIALYCCAWSV